MNLLLAMTEPVLELLFPRALQALRPVAIKSRKMSFVEVKFFIINAFVRVTSEWGDCLMVHGAECREPVTMLCTPDSSPYALNADARGDHPCHL
jgi:hypothetical protein